MSLMPKDCADQLLVLGWRKMDDPSGGEKWIATNALHFIEVDEWGDHIEVTVYRWRSLTGPVLHTFAVGDRRWLRLVEALS